MAQWLSNQTHHLPHDSLGPGPNPSLQESTEQSPRVCSEPTLCPRLPGPGVAWGEDQGQDGGMEEHREAAVLSSGIRVTAQSGCTARSCLKAGPSPWPGSLSGLHGSRPSPPKPCREPTMVLLASSWAKRLSSGQSQSLRLDPKGQKLLSVSRAQETSTPVLTVLGLQKLHLPFPVKSCSSRQATSPAWEGEREGICQLCWGAWTQFPYLHHLPPPIKA